MDELRIEEKRIDGVMGLGLGDKLLEDSRRRKHSKREENETAVSFPVFSWWHIWTQWMTVYHKLIGRCDENEIKEGVITAQQETSEGESTNEREPTISMIVIKTRITASWFYASTNQPSYRKHGHNHSALPELQHWVMGRGVFAEHYDVTVKLTFDHLHIKI